MPKLLVCARDMGAKDNGQNFNLSALIRTTTVDQIGAQWRDLNLAF